MNKRRQLLAASCRLAVAGVLAGSLGRAAGAPSATPVSISVPGPGNLLFLPITLASRLRTDEAEGISLDIRYTGGGPQSFRDMLDHNADFAAGGLAALALQRLSGKPVVCVVPTTRVPAYTLLVRSGLRDQVRSISDLAGKVVGVKGHVPGGRSTSQLFTEYVLARAGVTPERVNYVPVGQAYDGQHAALASGTVDAIMGDEPFATRLVKHKVAFVLADFHDPDTTRSQMGGLFLNGHVATRSDFVVNRPDIVGKVVQAIRNTLVWIDQHSAADMVDALALADADERAAMLDALSAHKNIYSPDGRISAEQVATVDRFFHATEKTGAAKALAVKDIINPQWAGSMP